MIKGKLDRYRNSDYVSIFKQIIVFVIKRELISQFKIQKFSQIFLKFILIGCEIEILGLWLASIRKSNSEIKNNILIDYIDMHLEVAQPYDDLQIQKTLSIVILIIQTMHYIYYIWEFVIFYIKKQKKFVSFTKYFERQPEFQKQLQQAMYYYNNIFNQVLFIPYLDINFSLLTNLFQGEKRIGFITISLINIIFVMFQSIIFETFLAESISIKRKNFEYLRYSFNNILQYLLMIILIILKSSPLDNQTRFVLMSITLILHHLFKIINIFQVNQPSKLTTFKITLFTFTTLLPIQFFCYKEMRGFDMFYVTISPLLSTILIFQFQCQQSQRLFSSKLQPDVIQYLLSLTLDEDQPSRLSELNYSIFLRYHSLDCLKAKCFCKKNNSQDIKMEFLKQLCIQFSQTLIIVGEEAQRFNYYLHFLSTMNYLGLNTQALKQAANIDFDSSSYLSMQSVRKYVSSSSNVSIKEKDQLQIDKKKIHFKNLSGIQQIKLDILKEIIQSGLNVNFTKTDNLKQESFSQTVKQFFEQEERQRQQINEILRLINRKRQFLMDIMSKINLNSKELFIKSKRLIIELESFYENQKLQSILSFFTGEIQGNYQKSHKITTLNKVNDEKLLGLQDQMTINLFSNKINYINCILNNDLTLKIKEKSINCYKFFEYKKSEFDLILNINKFLPYGFSQVHKSLVSQFMESGESKFFRSSNLNLIMTKNRFLKQFEFSFEINQTNQENLELIAFLEDHEQIHDNIIIASPNNKIGGVSKNFLKSISFSNETINSIDPLQLLYKHSIGYIIPDFLTVSSVSKTHILQEKQVHYSTNNSQKFYFLKEDYVLEQIKNQGQKFDWSNPDNLEVFTAISRTTKVEIYEDSYLIIILNNIKLGSTTLTQPKYTLTKSSFKQDFNVTSLDVLSEDGCQFPNAIVSNRPKIMVNQKIEDKNNEDNQFGNKFEIITKQEVQNLDITSMQQEKIEASYYSPYQQQILFSPKESFSGILQDKRKVQQQFFQSSFKDFSESNQKQSSSEKQLDIAQELFQLEADDQFRKVVQEQLQFKRAQKDAVEVDDIGSQVSSLVGFRKSKYYKKYELYDIYQESTIFPQTFKTMIYYYVLGILIGFTFALIVSINSSVDLQRFLNEIDMLSIKGYLMGPFYKFIIVLNSVAGYRFSIDFEGQPKDEMYQWMSFTAMEFDRTYDMLKNSFQDQMSNPYLQQFFIDEYIEIKFQTAIDGIETRNMTLREALSFLVLNGYIFKMTDPTSPLPAPNYPFITYYIANVLKFTDRFTLLTEVIQEYTNNRTYQVAEKWLAILIPLMCCFIAFKIISYYYYRQYLYNYDQACSLFNFIDMKSAQNEVQRLKVIQDLISKDPSTVYRYQFDIELKDSFILSQQNRQEQKELANLKQKHQQDRSIQKLSLLPSIMCFIFLAAIFLIYATLMNVLVQRFLISYRPSIEYFKSLSEASISISGIYNFRDFTYLIHGGTFYYYTSADVQPFINNFNADIQNVIEFQQNLISFTNKNILTSEKFNSLVNQYRANNLCSFINVNELTQYFNPSLPKPVIQDYCDVIYSGVMNLGLQPTLVEAVNKLQSEYLINNFTFRAGFVRKEFELPMIASQILIQLLAYYKQTLVDIADQLIYQIQILSAFTIVYLAIKCLLLLTTVLNYTKKEFLQSKKFIQILPQNLLFIDSGFERYLRTYAAQQQLI